MVNFSPQGFSSEYRLEVILPFDRSEYGEATLLSSDGIPIYGPFPVLGQANQFIANRNGNPSRNPLLPYGDTPVGTYSAWSRSTEIRNSRGQIYSQVTSTLGYSSYGSSGMLVLSPNAGEALEAAQNGRSGLLMHSGSLDESGALRPTAGCLRASAIDMLHITGYVAQHRAEINARVRVGEVTIYRAIPAARPNDDEQIPDPIIGANSNSRDDIWLDQVWEQILWTDQYVETGGLAQQFDNFMYENSQERNLDRLNQRGQDAARNAETSGGGPGSGDRGRDISNGRGDGERGDGEGGSGQRGEGGSLFRGNGEANFWGSIIYGRRPR